MSKKILLVGSSNMDLTMNLYKLPGKGETINDDGGVAYTPGGRAASTAVAFSKFGADAALCTKLGADVHGQRLFNFYKESGINTTYVKVDHDYPTGFAVVMKEADGAKRTVVYPGANEQLNSENILAAFDFEPDGVYLGFDIPFSVAVSAAKIAATKGIPIFVDASPASKSYPLENLPAIEIFSPNESEILEYTGVDPTGTDSCLRAAYHLFTKVKCKYVVIKLGARGAFIYDGKHCDLIPAFKPDKLVDTAGAGDAFNAAMVLEYLSGGGNIVSAVTYGAAAGAIAVSRAGASASIPSPAEVADFIRRKRM